MPTAVTSFACTVDDVEYFIREGDELPATHPVVKAHSELFKGAPATTSPGSTRKRQRT